MSASNLNHSFLQIQSSTLFFEVPLVYTGMERLAGLTFIIEIKEVLLIATSRSYLILNIGQQHESYVSKSSARVQHMCLTTLIY